MFRRVHIGPFKHHSQAGKGRDADGKKKFLTCVTASAKVSVTTAAFVWPDTHLIFLAGEVAFTESCSGGRNRPHINQLAYTMSCVTCALINVRYIRVGHSSPSCPHPPQHTHPGDLEKKKKKLRESEWQREGWSRSLNYSTKTTNTASTPNSGFFDLPLLLDVAATEFCKRMPGIEHDTYA